MHFDPQQFALINNLANAVKFLHVDKRDGGMMLESTVTCVNNRCGMVDLISIILLVSGSVSSSSVFYYGNIYQL